MDIAVLTRPVALDDEIRLYRLWPGSRRTPSTGASTPP